MSELRHSMKSVAQRTGLSPHVIRVWEKRYSAVEPSRSASNRRRYSDADIRRLSLLHAATKAGHTIGMIARLPEEQLHALAGWGAQRGGGPVATPAGSPSRDGFLDGSMTAIRRMNARELEAVLTRAGLELGGQGLLQHVIAPLTQQLGSWWLAGEVTAAEEHFASNVLRGFLANLARPFALPDDAPGLVVATPAGQLHEMGAILVAAAAAGYGWKVTYIGSGLPAVEIAASALRVGARAVALSLVYPADDPALPAELATLRRLLPQAVSIIAGGRAASAYREALERIQASIAGDLAGLYAILESLRATPAALAMAATVPVRAAA